MQQAILSWTPEPAAVNADTSHGAGAAPQETAEAGSFSRSTSTAAALAGAAGSGSGGVTRKLNTSHGRGMSEWDLACVQVLGESVQLWQVRAWVDLT